MRTFYIKKLNYQELGSPRPDGTTNRGRYLYVSKKCAVFFPHLSATQKNDTVLVPIVPSDRLHKVYSRFVYHNDKLNTVGGTRDEYRLYLNKSLDANGILFKLNDIAVFEKTIVDVGENTAPLYFLHLFSPSSENYDRLNELIMESPISGGHALYNGDLDYIPVLDWADGADIVIPDDVVAEIRNVQAETEAEQSSTIESSRGANLFNSVSFRDFVLLGYGYKCAITEKSIVWNTLNNLESAHIQPRAHGGSFLPCNGLALSRDMHWAFDKGFITIDDDFRVVVHPDVFDTMLGELSGKRIILPTEQYFQPERAFLRYHRENIYGLFLNSGSIRRLI